MIDHVISTIANGIIHHDILHNEEINNHDSPYVIFNIKKEKLRYKFIPTKKLLIRIALHLALSIYHLTWYIHLMTQKIKSRHSIS